MRRHTHDAIIGSEGREPIQIHPPAGPGEVIKRVWPDRSGFAAPVPSETTETTRSLERRSDIEQIVDLAIYVKSHLGVVARSRHLRYIDKSQLEEARQKMDEILRLAKKIRAEG